MILSDLEKKVIPAVPFFDLYRHKKSASAAVVISPHPDDDVIGMGGSMRLLADKGVNVFSVYITDGSSKIFKDRKISEVRQKEAIDALGVVRAKGGIFLKHKSGKLPFSKIVKEIIEVLDFFRPETLYVTSPFERHPTHLKVTEMTIKALRQIKNYCPAFWGYNVWSGNWRGEEINAFDIKKVINIKKKAICMHKSQQKYKDYASGMIGRNRYEGVFLNTHAKKSFEYAETFVNMKDLARSRSLTLKGFLNRMKGL
jgi:LmbE family N-acetylglucosaminyl deacetylase